MIKIVPSVSREITVKQITHANGIINSNRILIVFKYGIPMGMITQKRVSGAFRGSYRHEYQVVSNNGKYHLCGVHDTLEELMQNLYANDYEVYMVEPK